MTPSRLRSRRKVTMQSRKDSPERNKSGNRGEKSTSEPFSHVASAYDREFTAHPLGRRKRNLVYRRLAPLLDSSSRLLELNGGTGEDARWLSSRCGSLLTTDASPAMLQETNRKLFGGDGVSAEHQRRVQTGLLRIEELWGEESGSGVRLVEDGSPYSLILSNFDGVNCIAERAKMAEALADLLQPNGDLLLIFMARHTIFEKLESLLRGNFRRAWRGRGAIDGTMVPIGGGASITTWFPSIREVITTFREHRFRLIRTEAIGLLTPPTTRKEFYRRHQSLYRSLQPIEDLLATLPVQNRSGDHVLLHFRVEE